MCWWILRKSTTALPRRFEPFLRRATRRWARRSFFCAWRYSLGFSISASSDSVAKEDKPRSMPTAAFVSGSGCTEVSTEKQTYQCSHSRLTETVLHLAVQRAMQLHFDVADALHEQVTTGQQFVSVTVTETNCCPVVTC